MIVQKAGHGLSPSDFFVTRAGRTAAPSYGCFFISAQEAIREAPPAATYM
jgi:hypothetical protein